MKLKIPSFKEPLAKLRSFRWQAKSKSISRERMPVRRQAAMRRAAQDFEEMDEPTTKLSSAFVVVLILHIVAVAGIYAFNSIKAHRRSREVPVASAERPSARMAPMSDATGLSTAGNAGSRTVSQAPVVPAQSVYHANGGEPLARVAALKGVSTAELAKLNGLREAAVLKAGDTLVIPQTKSAKAAAAASASASDAKRAEFVANRNDDAAFVKSTAPIKLGATAAKPTVVPVKPAAAPKTITVAKGDTLTSIARKNGVSVEELMKVNKIDDAKKLQPAQALKIPAKKAE